MTNVGGRPEYESAENREQEHSVISAVCSRWNAEAKKLPRQYRLDYMLMKDRTPVAFAEVKCRSLRSDYLKTYMISLSKLMVADQINRVTGLPVFLIVRWSDKAGYCSLNDGFDYAGFHGRDDRGDSEDMEPVVYLNISNRFTTINLEED